MTPNLVYAMEVEATLGQCMSPTLNIDGTILPDASVKDVAKTLKERGITI